VNASRGIGRSLFFKQNYNNIDILTEFNLGSQYGFHYSDTFCSKIIRVKRGIGKRSS
jgi:hypothetical protein